MASGKVGARPGLVPITPRGARRRDSYTSAAPAARVTPGAAIACRPPTAPPRLRRPSTVGVISVTADWTARVADDARNHLKRGAGLRLPPAPRRRGAWRGAVIDGRLGR